MSGIEYLNSMSISALSEIASIGCGNAVSALSRLLNRRIDMSVPLVNILDFKDIANFIGGGEAAVVGVFVGISGDINGMMMFLLKRDSAETLLRELLAPDQTSSRTLSPAGRDPLDMTELELSALTEIGSILSGSYLSALAGLIGKKISRSVPSAAVDMANAILSVPAIEFGKAADKVLFIESVFRTDDIDVSGYFMLVPDMPSLESLLKSLGVGA